MNLLIIVLIITCLINCVGVGNKTPNPIAIYDFGLSEDKAKFNSLVPILDITSIEPLNSTHIRYRLNHENPSRVFNYTESRWSTTPAELLAQVIKTHTDKPSLLNCNLSIELDAFDHVYDSLNSSHGVALIRVTLQQKKTRVQLATQTFKHQVPANLHNAQGGVAALNHAGLEVLNQAIAWANQQALNAGVCQ
jgi:cholesterol transport system auxiliary component